MNFKEIRKRLALGIKLGVFLSTGTGCTNHISLNNDPTASLPNMEKSVIPKDAEAAFSLALQNNDVRADRSKRLEMALDLNGDEVLDYVISVESSFDSEPKLLMVLVSENGFPQVLSRSTTIQYPTPQKIQIIKARNSSTYTSQPVFGDGLLITKTESSSAILYWNGIELVSTWVGE